MFGKPPEAFFEFVWFSLYHSIATVERRLVRVWFDQRIVGNLRLRHHRGLQDHRS